MTKVIGVRFRTAGKIYYFSPGKFEIKQGDHVIVETARGGRVWKGCDRNQKSKRSRGDTAAEVCHSDRHRAGSEDRREK